VKDASSHQARRQRFHPEPFQFDELLHIINSALEQRR